LIFIVSTFSKCFLLFALAMTLAGCATTPADVRAWAAPGDDGAAKKVEPALYSADPAVRAAALECLLKMTDSYTAMDAMMDATLSLDPGVRGDAGAALVFHPHPDLDFYSITLVADSNPGVRRRMAEGLAAAGRAGPLVKTQRAGIYLWGLLQDDNGEVRAAAAKGLGELGMNDPIGFSLDALRHDPEPRVRAAAASGLGELAHAFLNGERGPDWHDPAVEGFLNRQIASNFPTPTQEHGDEIVAALCQAAQSDDGKYLEITNEPTLFGHQRVVVTRWVAAAAAEALATPGKAPRAEVAAAIAAAQSRTQAELPSVPPPAPVVLHIHHPATSL